MHCTLVVQNDLPADQANQGGGAASDATQRPSDPTKATKTQFCAIELGIFSPLFLELPTQHSGCVTRAVAR